MSNSAFLSLPANAQVWISGSEFEPTALLLHQQLHDNGYKPRTIDSYLACVAHFVHWCSVEKITINVVNDSTKARFINQHLPECQCDARCQHSRANVQAAMQHLLALMRQTDLIETKPQKYAANIRVELDEFDSYLDNVKGLQLVTRNTQLKHTAAFLHDRFSQGQVNIEKLRPCDVSSYIYRSTAGWKPASVRVVCTALRGYFRFKAVQGISTAPLIAALPRIAHWPLASLPKALSCEEIQTLLSSFDRQTAGGLRDYAIARCYIDLGLRTAEVVRLQLDDMDWRAGVFHIRGKGRRKDTLPLPQVTGEAIVDYLQHSRQASTSRALFLRLRPPYQHPADPNTIRAAIRNAANRCGLAKRLSGPHVLRHTLATRLVQNGTTLKEVSDLLRHRELNTTVIYAKVDTRALSAIASPWPENHS